MSSKVITRFPPSPTGYLHIGSARTALFNYLYAKSRGGEMLMRFEDTDRERSKNEFEKDILEGLQWLGMPVSTSVIRQSERGGVYQPHVKKLLESGAAYEAEAGKENPDKKVIRFKNPNKPLTFKDEVRGGVTFDTSDLKDFVIAKSVDEPLYHLAVVIDDHEMGVTHVIRGEDHISNTPRQLLILEALGFERPVYAHIPLILAPDRTKLSKRHGAVSVNEYRAQGFMPEALINYLALLGWNPGGEREIFTLGELVQQFSLERVHKGGAVFDIEKLKWFNHEHLKKISDDEYAKHLEKFIGKPVDVRFMPLCKERAKTLKEAELIVLELESIKNEKSLDRDLLLKNDDAQTAKKHLSAVQSLLKSVSDEGFTAEAVKEAVFPYATQEGRGAVLWPLRVALSGKEKSPDPFTLMHLLGKKESQKRIEAALAML